MAELRIADATDRDTLGTFVARAVRLDGQAVVRLRAREPDAVQAWFATPFDVLATRAVAGSVAPSDVTVSGSELLAAVTVAGGERMDPGVARDLQWQSELPVVREWQLVDDLPTTVVSDLAGRGIDLARDNAGPRGTPPASLMDQVVLSVHGHGMEIKIHMRYLFALSGMGFFDPSIPEDVVRVSATDSWVRLNARYGAVVRRRQALLPLLV